MIIRIARNKIHMKFMGLDKIDFIIFDTPFIVIVFTKVNLKSMRDFSK